MVSRLKIYSDFFAQSAMTASDCVTLQPRTENDVLLTLETWEDIHPFLTTIPVNWGYTMPYGIIYPLEPTPEVLDFVNIIKTAAV